MLLNRNHFSQVRKNIKIKAQSNNKSGDLVATNSHESTNN
jgi:hypothetical protein